ncbi:MAG: hypothetical protein VB080_09070 [Propionicimonas sp.]|uniref:hypothetical protein n=1 Tax=Propionicimonas sp. TaxID=1955623 RepID=UPI002B1F7B2C|nr:hypothetical protein [Propionicimonas sp.]MEA4944573.1 hypothetical protein [Propionicimonas sp.]
MSGLYPAGNPWFRLGRLEVGTVMLVVISVVASWVLWVAAPGSAEALYFSPDLVAGGGIWRLVTWPWVNPLSLWAVLDVFFLWYFGRDLEAQLGRSRTAWLLLGIWGALTVASAIIWLIMGGGMGLAGIGLVQMLVLLLWIAENPTRRFFFNIPAWVIGAVILGLQILTWVAARAFDGLLALLLGLVLVALVAKRVGLLSQYAWIPGRAAAPRAPKRRTARASKEVRVAVRNHERAASDRDQLDALLDQINERGLDSLTPAQRREMMRLRDRLRGS